MDKSFWYLASYPKSGNTWCRAFVSELIRLKNCDSSLEQTLSLNKDLNTGSSIASRTWIDDQLGFSSSDLRMEELAKFRNKIGLQRFFYDENSIFYKVHDAFLNPYTKNLPAINLRGCRGAVYITRNPFDITVSLSSFFSWTLEETVNFIIDDNSKLGNEFSGGPMVNQFLGNWENHVLGWLNQKNIPVLKIRYEDLINEPRKSFSSIATFLKFDLENKILEKILKNISFESMKEKEKKEGGFCESPPKCSQFFRKGIIGEGLIRLSKNQIKLINNRFSDTLRLLNYDEYL